jgi:hypothetical protein
MSDLHSLQPIAMSIRRLRHLFQPFNTRVGRLGQALSRPANAIIFLVVRFVLMSGMVVGFSWYAFNLSP